MLGLSRCACWWPLLLEVFFVLAALWPFKALLLSTDCGVTPGCPLTQPTSHLQVRMASETLEVFSVLANRLGAWSLKAELEDLAFKALHPEEYACTAAAIQAHTAVEGASSEDADGLGAHLEAVAAALAAAGVQVVDVSGRVKNVYGVWKKMRDGGRVEEVFDVQALRVVVPHKHDCYAALRAVEGLWAPVPGRFKDYIRHRKANGYQVGVFRVCWGFVWGAWEQSVMWLCSGASNQQLDMNCCHCCTSAVGGPCSGSCRLACHTR